ncbi:heparanase [Centropristis striata]|uniref:heparanase n=1 Tax=Centropristis striata TaxID=184440 RepID=UPI0027E0D397|nr:heparanase [Centropristis striata]
MESVSLLLLVLLPALLRVQTGSGVRLPDLDLDPDPDLDSSPGVVELDLSAALHRVDRRFLSVTIDASLAAEEKFMSLLGSVRLRTLAAALAPAFLRFGGTRQDFMVFSPQTVLQGPGLPAEPSCDKRGLPRWLEDHLRKAWRQQQDVLRTEGLQRKFIRAKFTEYTVDLLHSFSNCSGLDLIFGLNALLRTADNSWNSSNAHLLLQYCESRGYDMSWELGNEPNSFEKKAGIRVDGQQLGRDFSHLRAMMSQSKLYAGGGLYGPDVGQPRAHGTDLLPGFLQSGAGAVNACTWHHYYVNGRDTSLDDFLDPGVLDSLASKTQEVLQKVKLESPEMPVWLGETSSAFGGGAAGLSDTFAAGFMWLDKLGLAARLGLDVVMRQVFFGSGFYHLVDENLDPLPDYWLSVLYKRLVGPEVLKVGFSGAARSKRTRLYLHCANRDRYSEGAVTLISLNLRKKPTRISVPAASSRTVEAFVLVAERPGEEGLLSRSVRLNGDVLKMLGDETLPELTGRRLPPSEHLQLPAFSLSFHVLTDAGASACNSTSTSTTTSTSTLHLHLHLHLNLHPYLNLQLNLHPYLNLNLNLNLHLNLHLHLHLNLNLHPYLHLNLHPYLNLNLNLNLHLNQNLHLHLHLNLHPYLHLNLHLNLNLHPYLNLNLHLHLNLHLNLHPYLHLHLNLRLNLNLNIHLNLYSIST